MAQESTNQDVSPLHFYENPRWRLLSTTLWNVLILVILAIVVLVGSMSPAGFWSSTNVQSILWTWLAPALLVPAMSLIIASGGIDLSVGSVAGFTAIVMASMLASDKANIGGALMAGLLLAFLAGLVNGFLIGVCRLNAVIVTLGMMTALRGITYMIAQNVIAVADAGFLSSLALPAVVLVLLIIVCIVATELRYRGNTERSKPNNSASWIGQSLRIGLPYVLSGTVAGLVGAVLLGRLRAGTPSLGTGLEVDVILMTVLGGTALGGGVVNILGGVLAALVVGMVQNIALLNGVPQLTVSAGKGIALLFFGVMCPAYYYIVNLIFIKTKKDAIVKESKQEVAPTDSA